MAVTTISTNDYYKTGDTVDVIGMWMAATGNDGSVGFIVPTKKKIPNGATLTAQSITVGFMVDTSANTVSYTFANAQPRGENIMLVYDTNKSGAHNILTVFINYGRVIIG